MNTEFITYCSTFRIHLSAMFWLKHSMYYVNIYYVSTALKYA